MKLASYGRTPRVIDSRNLDRMPRLALFALGGVAAVAVACGSDDPRTEASQYALDPIPCTQDLDCCVVNDRCLSTAYLVASKDSAKVASLIASADNSTCNKCLTPMLQLSCGPSGSCVGERIERACSFPMAYPGNHCGKLDVPPSCLVSTSSDDAGAQTSDGGIVKPLGIFSCGG